MPPTGRNNQLRGLQRDAVELCRFGLFRRNEQQLVDALAVHVDHFDPPAGDLEGLALRGDAREPLERQAGGGMELAVLDVQAEAFRQLVDRRAAVDQP